MQLPQEQIAKIQRQLAEGKISAKEALTIILRGDSEAASTFTNQMQKEKQKSTASCKEYHVVTVKENCTHCKSTFEREVKITPKEHVPVITEDNHYVEVGYNGALKTPIVLSYTHCCDKCDEFIKNMDREELEYRYKEILRHHISANLNNERISHKLHPVKEDPIPMKEDIIEQEVISLDDSRMKMYTGVDRPIISESDEVEVYSPIKEEEEPDGEEDVV
jgi:hypothetical protein